MNNKKLPKDYTPIKELNICSNQMINGKIPIEIEGNIPFLVGEGEVPLVWMSLPLIKNKWIDVIIKNKLQFHKQGNIKTHLITINESLEERKVDIEFMRIKVFSAIMKADESAEIKHLDFRPFGLSIYGDNNSLFIGNQQLINNVMENVTTMIGIGKSKKL